MNMQPITVRLDEGGTVRIFPDRAVAAVASGAAESRVWHYDVDGLIEEIVVRAELGHVRVALGLDD